MRGACSTHGGNEKCIKMFSQKNIKLWRPTHRNVDIDMDPTGSE
jgi:hypothetical protein